MLKAHPRLVEWDTQFYLSKNIDASDRPFAASPSVTLSIIPKIPNEQTVDRVGGGWKGILYPHG